MTSAVGSPPIDILVRTSGVKRLSDFLTWQVRLSNPRVLACVDVISGMRRYSNPVFVDLLAGFRFLGFLAYIA